MKPVLALLIFVISTCSAVAQSQDWQKTWDTTLAAARKEGKVVVVGSPDPVMRNEIIPKFRDRYGIAIEYIATGSGGQTAQKLSTERSSGIYTVDVFLNNVGPAVNVLYAQKMIDPIKPLLILPEVVEGAGWKSGKPTFVDPEDQYLMLLFSSVDGLIFINTQYVKPEEIRSVQDLLNPKWKGKIASEYPSSSGTGINKAIHFYMQLGPEFLKKLYIDQQPTFSRERRQLTDWLVRGTHPICLTCRLDDANDLQKDGFKLIEIYDLPDLKARVVAAPFLLALANKSPHPNAARIFVNWMATKEAMEIYSRGYGAATLRRDVDESFLDKNNIPQPNVSYADDTDFKWVSTGRQQASEEVRAILKLP